MVLPLLKVGIFGQELGPSGPVLGFDKPLHMRMHLGKMCLNQMEGNPHRLLTSFDWSLTTVESDWRRN